MTSYSIGRARESAIELPEMTVSRQHAELIDNGDGSFTVRDVGSSYGTYIHRNGDWEQITEITATENIALRFGGMETSLAHLLTTVGLDLTGGAPAASRAPEAPAPRPAAPAPPPEPARPAPPQPPKPARAKKEKAPKQPKPAAAPKAPKPAKAPKQPKAATGGSGTIFGLPALWVFIGGGALIALIVVIVAVVALTGGGPLGTSGSIDKAGIIAACEKDGKRTRVQCECTANVIVAETDEADRARITEIVQNQRDRSKIREIMAKMTQDERRKFLLKMIRISGQIASKCRAS